MITKTHHFFLLVYNPWPVLSSISSFNLLFSLLILFKMHLEEMLLGSILNIIFISFIWWIFYSGEFSISGCSSFILEKGLKVGMILFISSEVFFFFSFFWSYFQFFLAPSIETGLMWPPQNVEMFNCLNVPLINTLVLMGSGVTVTLSHNFLVENKNKYFNFFLMLTVLMGILFSVLQLMEYSTSFFSISDSTFGTVFFVLTGFHGIHVLVGSIFLSACFYRSHKMVASSSNFMSFEMASWYWHFVDVVWIFLYFFIYYLNN